jgi:DNA-damage-inducible protein J
MKDAYMSKSVYINIRTTNELKTKAEDILKNLGLNMSAAVNLFLKQLVNYRGIPFDLKVPNEETLQAMEDIENKRNLNKAVTVDEMFDKIGV